MRISVELVRSLLVQGETSEEILDDYPDLEPDDIRACLAYAHAVIAHDRLEKLFELYTKMTAAAKATSKPGKSRK